jgi:hypothetical protein
LDRLIPIEEASEDVCAATVSACFAARDGESALVLAWRIRLNGRFGEGKLNGVNLVRL